jgi:hypothetical protein
VTDLLHLSPNENNNRKPCSAPGIEAIKRSIIVSMPTTNGSRENPTVGSSKNHLPAHL